MQHDMQDRFDQLEVWFEPTGRIMVFAARCFLTIPYFQETTNQYKPTSYSRFRHLPKAITFTSPDPERFPVPSPELLALYAACFKVALRSGAAGYLDKYDRDMYHFGVLDPDSTSSGALHHAIWKKLGGSVDIGREYI